MSCFVCKGSGCSVCGQAELDEDRIGDKAGVVEDLSELLRESHAPEPDPGGGEARGQQDQRVCDRQQDLGQPPVVCNSLHLVILRCRLWDVNRGSALEESFD